MQLRWLPFLVFALVACTQTAPATPTPPPTPTLRVMSSPVLTGEDRERVLGWAESWNQVARFRAEVSVFEAGGALQQRLQLEVILPDRLHAVQIDPSTGQPLLEWIIIGDAGWVRRGDQWRLGRLEQPLSLANLYDPATLVEGPDGAAGPSQVELEQLADEMIDGVSCETWQITVRPTGQDPNRMTLWLGQRDQLPRQLRTEYPDRSVLLIRYWGYEEDFEIQPPKGN